MKAVRLYDALDLRVEEVDAPSDVPPGHVLLRVEAAGICGSDLHNYRTGQWITRRPSTAGHELSGAVAALGEGVEGFALGDRVVADSRVWCGACPACLSGRSNICEKLGFVGEVCDGGFAEAVVLPARLLVKHDPSLPARVAAMAEPLAVALHAVRRLSAPAGEPVLVAGCGTIGGLCALLLAKLHDGPVLLSDLNTARARMVAELVGGTVVALKADAVAEALGPHARLRFAIDATGHVGAIDATLKLLAGGGALALVGISHGKLDLDPNLLVERETALLGCHAFNGELPETVAMLPELAPALLAVSETLSSLDDIPAAYDRLLKGEAARLKTLVDLSEDSQRL